MTAYIALIVAAVLSLAGWRLHHAGFESGQKEVQTRWTADTARLTVVSLAATTKARADEDKRNTTQAGVTNHVETTRRIPARAAAVAAAAAGSGLRDPAKAVAARGRAAAENPAATGECKAAGAASAVLAELLVVSSERRIELARYADEAAAAGAECVGRYDALMEATP